MRCGCWACGSLSINRVRGVRATARLAAWLPRSRKLGRPIGVAPYTDVVTGPLRRKEPPRPAGDGRPTGSRLLQGRGKRQAPRSRPGVSMPNGTLNRASSLCVARQYRHDPRDEFMEVRHVNAQELGRLFVGDLAIVGNKPGRELDVRLRRIHLRSV